MREKEEFLDKGILGYFEKRKTKDEKRWNASILSSQKQGAFNWGAIGIGEALHVDDVFNILMLEPCASDSHMFVY